MNRKTATAPSILSRVTLRWIIVSVIALITLVHVGFYKSYLRFFPEFDGFVIAQHFHGAMMMGWLLILLAQPILILKGRSDLHRQVGAFGHAWVVLLILSIYLVIKSRYALYLERGGQTSAIIGWLSINFRLMLFFIMFYVLAVCYRHQPALHIRFICSAAFLLIAPALVRLLISYTQLGHANSHSFDRNAGLLLAGIMALADSWCTRRASPFLLLLACAALQKVMWEYRDTEILQAIGIQLAKLL